MYCANGYPALLVKFAVCWNYFWCIFTTELTRVLKYQTFLGILQFLLVNTINPLSIPHIPMNFDNFLTHFRFLLKTIPGASETTCMKVCKISLMSYVCFSEHGRGMQLIFDCEWHKLIL